MKKFMLLLLIFSATIYVSYKYSGRVYINYLRIYYTRFYTEDELLLKSKEKFEKKQFKDLESFLKPLLVIYPDNNEFKKIAAFNYLKLGDTLKSSEIFAGISVDSIEENRNLEEILKNLYSSGNYGDLLFFYDKKVMINNVNTAMYYGISLYRYGRYDESYKSLMFAKNNTFMLPELYFYIGLNLDKKGKTMESIEYIKTAYEADRFNQTYKKTLIDIYRKSGLHKEAEVLLRRR